MPPSRAPDDPDYDDRMFQVLHAMRTASAEPLDLDIRPILRQRQSIEAAHRGGPRLTPDQLHQILDLDEEYAEPAPSTLTIIDDVLTTGAHFMAARRLLRERFGSLSVIGLFVARVIHRE